MKFKIKSSTLLKNFEELKRDRLEKNFQKISKRYAHIRGPKFKILNLKPKNKKIFSILFKNFLKIISEHERGLEGSLKWWIWRGYTGDMSPSYTLPSTPIRKVCSQTLHSCNNLTSTYEQPLSKLFLQLVQKLQNLDGGATCWRK